MKNKKSGVFFSIKSHSFLLMEFEEKSNYFYLTYKDLESGKIRKEPYCFDYLDKVKLEDWKYLYEEDDKYIFANPENKLIPIDKKLLSKEIKNLKNGEEITVKHKVSPVYININTEIKKKSVVYLNSKTESAEIYYTLDGSIPNKKSLKYNDPFEVNPKTILNTVAYKKRYIKSIVSAYNFKIKKAKKPIIYLSPSNQTQNLGYENTGYTNEGDMMNKLCDLLEPKLKEIGFLVYRNNPNDRTWENPYEKVAKWGSESKKLNADLHLAIHSNGSAFQNKKGIEVWIHDEKSSTYSLATKLIDNLYSIYYDNQNAITYRGVKYGLGYIEEVKPNIANNAILIEIAYHDNKSDAIWMFNNLDEISFNLLNTLKEYFNM